MPVSSSFSLPLLPSAYIHLAPLPSLPPILRRIGGDIAEVVEGKKKGHFSCLTRDPPPPSLPWRRRGLCRRGSLGNQWRGDEGRKKESRRKKEEEELPPLLFFMASLFSFTAGPSNQQVFIPFLVGEALLTDHPPQGRERC